MKLSKLTSAVILLVASNVNAATITYNFEGSVDYSNGTVFGSFVGRAISGSYTFESTGDSNKDDPEIGVYAKAVKQLNATILDETTGDTYDFSANAGAADGNLTVINSTSDTYKFDFNDSINMIDSEKFPNTNWLASAFHFNLTDTSGEVFQDDTLPLTKPDLNAFDLSSHQVPHWQLEFSTTYDYYLSGEITKLTLAPSAVPIPASAWLFASGLLGLVGVARRKTQV